MKEQNLKGLVHLGLAAVSAVEARKASPLRKFLLGLATGWHVYATFYHWVQENDPTYPPKPVKENPYIPEDYKKKLSELWAKHGPLCPYCSEPLVQTSHGPYCPKPTCKWGWEVEMDGSPLKPPLKKWETPRWTNLDKPSSI